MACGTTALTKYCGENQGFVQGVAQPYSKAGKRAGAADERNLWPAFYHIISQCRPLTVFGEQVGNKNSLPWLDTVHSDLENIDYTAVDSPAAGYGAPHIRQRLYWVGTTEILRLGNLYSPRLQTPLLNERGEQLANQTFHLLQTEYGKTVNGLCVTTANTDQLNPSFTRWLVGLPPVWDACADSLLNKQSSS